MSQHHGYALDSGLKVLLAGAGLPHEDVLRRAGLPEDLLNRPDARVTSERFFMLVRAMQDAVDDPALAVRLASAATAESFSPVVFAALCSPNLTIAADRLAKFKPLIAPVKLRSETSEMGLTLTFDFLHQALSPPRFLCEFELAFLVKLARMGTRSDIRAQRVTMFERPPEPAPHEAYLGCRIQEGDALSITFGPEDATRTFLTNNSGMWDIFEPQLQRRLADLEGSASFEARTRAVLLEALPSGQASVELVARRLAVSSRTLQRRLRDEGTNFKTVTRATRESLSRYYLEHTRLSSTEIAYLLGFEEPNSFFRAFQSWTGTSPESLRRSVRPRASTS